MQLIIALRIFSGDQVCHGSAKDYQRHAVSIIIIMTDLICCLLRTCDTPTCKTTSSCLGVLFIVFCNPGIEFALRCVPWEVFRRGCNICICSIDGIADHASFTIHQCTRHKWCVNGIPKPHAKTCSEITYGIIQVQKLSNFRNISTKYVHLSNHDMLMLDE